MATLTVLESADEQNNLQNDITYNKNNIKINENNSLTINRLRCQFLLYHTL